MISIVVNGNDIDFKYNMMILMMALSIIYTENTINNAFSKP